jgi:hypothetical protein
MIDDTYISWLVKTGQEKQPSVNHSNPDDYGLTRKDTILARLRYLRSKLKEAEKDYRFWNSELLNNYCWFSEQRVLECQRVFNKLEKDITFNVARLKYKEDKHIVYDISVIKTIPLNKITEILPSGFFAINPFRNETVPSNSLHWDKKTNRYHDFGDGRSGDVIDLYMKINNCDTITALRELSNIT